MGVRVRLGVRGQDRLGQLTQSFGPRQADPQHRASVRTRGGPCRADAVRDDGERVTCRLEQCLAGCRQSHAGHVAVDTTKDGTTRPRRGYLDVLSIWPEVLSVTLG